MSGKRINKAREGIDRIKLYAVEEAVICVSTVIDRS